MEKRLQVYRETLNTGDYPVGPDLIARILKSREFSPSGSAKVQQRNWRNSEIPCVRGTRPAIAGGAHGRPEKEVGSFQRPAPSPTDSKQVQTSDPQPFALICYSSNRKYHSRAGRREE